MEKLINAKNRRASHFYGHLTRQGDDMSEGMKKITGAKKMPPKPRYYDFHLSKAREKFDHKVLTFKLPCCQRQLALFPRETAWNL